MAAQDIIQASLGKKKEVIITLGQKKENRSQWKKRGWRREMRKRKVQKHKKEGEQGRTTRQRETLRVRLQ